MGLPHRGGRHHFLQSASGHIVRKWQSQGLHLGGFDRVVNSVSQLSYLSSGKMNSLYLPV